MNFDIVILGHFAKDKLIIKGVEKDALGGAVYYGAIALSKINISTGIITMLAKEDYSHLDIFTQNDIQVFAHVASATSGIKNTYITDNLDQRICEPIAFAGAFKKEDIPDIKTKIFHIGPIMAGEVSLDLIKYISSRYDNICLDLQGFVRVISGNELKYIDWQEKEQGLQYIDILKADSTEAEIVSGKKNLEQAAKALAALGPKEVLITHADGVLVLADNRIFNAKFNPVTMAGRTGRGDTCFCSYLGARLTLPPEESCRFAAALTSLKLEKEGPFDKSIKDVRERMEILTN